MKNSKVKQFEAKINLVVEEKKAVIINEVEKHLSAFNEIYLESFTNERPYGGEFKNKIFFTYCNHYRGNLGTWMEVGELTHPHVSYEDRGYIKGVVTDLDGYMKLRSANGINHNFNTISYLYLPKFRNSTHSDQYRAECNSIVSRATSELNSFIEIQKKAMNIRLNELTGCSLLHYLRNL